MPIQLRPGEEPAVGLESLLATLADPNNPQSPNFEGPPAPGAPPQQFDPAFLQLLSLVDEGQPETFTPEQEPKEPGFLQNLLGLALGTGVGYAAGGDPEAAGAVAGMISPGAAIAKEKKEVQARNREQQEAISLRNQARRMKANQQRMEILLQSMESQSALNKAETSSQTQLDIQQMRNLIAEQKLDIDRLNAQTKQMDVISKAEQRRVDSMVKQGELALDQAIRTGDLALKERALELNDRIQSGRLAVEEGRLGIDRYEALWKEEVARLRADTDAKLKGAITKKVDAETAVKVRGISKEVEEDFGATMADFDKLIIIRNGEPTFTDPSSGQTINNVDDLIALFEERLPRIAPDAETQRRLSYRFRKHLSETLKLKNVPLIPDPDATAVEGAKSKVAQAKNKETMGAAAKVQD